MVAESSFNAPLAATAMFMQSNADGTDGSVQQVFVLDLKTPGAPAVPMTFWPSVNGHPGWAHGRAVTGAVRTQ